MRYDLENLDGRWLCVQVRFGYEFKSVVGLKERGYETFLPVFEQKRQWSDRVKIAQVPLFAGYVFVRFNASGTYPVVTAPGVIRFLGKGKIPSAIDDSEIEALQIMTRAGLTCGPCAFLEVGQEVEVRLGTRGSFRGKIVRFKNRQRVILSVNLIKKSAFVEVDGYDVVPITSPAVSGKVVGPPVLERDVRAAS